MQWLIDLVIEAIGIPPVYIDRGDPAAHDYTILTLTMDGAWNTLDLSAIVPAGAKAVALTSEVGGLNLFADFRMRKKGNVNEFAMTVLKPVVVGVAHYSDSVVAVDTDRKIEYKGAAPPISFVTLVVKGWWL